MVNVWTLVCRCLVVNITITTSHVCGSSRRKGEVDWKKYVQMACDFHKVPFHLVFRSVLPILSLPHPCSFLFLCAPLDLLLLPRPSLVLLSTCCPSTSSFIPSCLLRTTLYIFIYSSAVRIFSPSSGAQFVTSLAVVQSIPLHSVVQTWYPS